MGNNHAHFLLLTFIVITYHRSSQGNRRHSFSPVRTEQAIVMEIFIPEDIQTNKSEYLHPFHHTHLLKRLACQRLQFRNGSPPRNTKRSGHCGVLTSDRAEGKCRPWRCLFWECMHVSLCVCVCNLLSLFPSSLGDPPCVCEASSGTGTEQGRLLAPQKLLFINCIRGRPLAHS